MLPKTPKFVWWKIIKGGAKTLFIFEAIAFAASYGVYYRMNTNRDFRQYIDEHFPSVLNCYYKVGEILGDSNLRQLDSAVWNTEKQQNQKK